MNKTMAFTFVAMSTLASSSAYSSDGIVQFAGHASEESCNLSINGNGSSEGTVVLPSVNLSELTNSDDAVRTEFSIAMNDCNTSNAVRPYFESNNAGANGRLGNTTAVEDGGAEFVYLVIYNDDGKVLNIGGYIPEEQIPFKPTDSAGEVTFDYAVGMTGLTDHSTIGLVTSSLVYSIEYQ